MESIPHSSHVSLFYERFSVFLSGTTRRLLFIEDLVWRRHTVVPGEPVVVDIQLTKNRSYVRFLLDSSLSFIGYVSWKWELRHKSLDSLRSRTCYPRRAFIQGLTDDSPWLACLISNNSLSTPASRISFLLFPFLEAMVSRERWKPKLC
jgi:hypothetical protein